MTLHILFWIFFFILFYTFLGYALILFLVISVKRIFQKKQTNYEENEFEPEVCLFVTAYNEKDFILKKIENSFLIDYPKEKIQYLWITDGSDDGTPDILKKNSKLEVQHLPERRGKVHAMNRGMQFVKMPIVIFSDSNTILGKDSIREIVAKFRDSKVGCVAGEKRIVEKQVDAAAGAGEGLYWKFESWIKNMDAELNSAVGAAGELFAIRRELFDEVEQDTLLDDFIISLRIVQKGYKIAYAQNAWAEETASLNINEELKRKIRIAAGGIQTVFRLKALLNPFKNGVLTWQYFSHKVLRWTLAPISLFSLFIVNFFIVLGYDNWLLNDFYTLFFYLQLLLFFIVLLGWYFENKRLRFKLLFVPFYFVAINIASLFGIIRYFKGKQSVNWEKSKRASVG